VSGTRKLWIEGPAGRLEAALRVAPSPRAAVVFAHPHPVHGGTLHNPVIFHSERAVHRDGSTTLRFNFRSAGSSEGVHDEGRGEVDDLAAAVSWLRGAAPGVPLLLVGYSFGAWCSVRLAAEDRSIAGVVAIGLTTRIYPFPEIRTLARPLAVVQGSADELGPIAEVQALLDEARPRGDLYVIEGATHLFPGRAFEVAPRVVEAVRACLDEAQRSSEP
jgi:alpha/beta superfamily hydrolase